MQELVEYGIQKMDSMGLDYGDLRISDISTQEISVKNGSVESIKDNLSSGVGIRILKDGWGFASTSTLTKQGVERAVERALKIAKASSLASPEVTLAPVKVYRDEYVGECKKDPFKVPLEEKLELLMEAEKRMKVDDRIKVTNATMMAWRFKKWFASTEGARIEQDIVQCGAGINATATDGSDMQRRSYPNSFGGVFRSMGYEFIESLKMIEHGEQVGKEVVELLKAEQCPSEEIDLILEPSQLALQIHESCGHPTELDRVLGTEASYAGTSFLTPDKLNKLIYGSEIVNLVNDATEPRGLGTFGYDDEGVKARSVDMVRNGLFVGYQSSREDAAQIGVEVSGNMRADGWQNLPLVRMTNINLEPGDWSREEIIEETEDGIIMDTIKSWSIDDKRLNFQFGTEAGYRVRNGEIVGLIKNPTYTGITYEFWRKCNAIAGNNEWEMHGFPNCGKGEPPQTMHVGHGCAPSRFEKIRAGVGKW
ncbi:MAG: TldD/PmbA family protein [Thermoplasmata archaeon]